MKKVIDFLIGITCLDWKPYTLALAGFLLGTFAGQLGNRYGVLVGSALILSGWWCVLGGLLIARRNDWPLYKIIFKD